MKWRFRADHGQKHEAGDWMHFELDDQGLITEAAGPKVHFRLSSSGVGYRTDLQHSLPGG